MKILALELSSSHGSIAWNDGGAAQFSLEFINDRKHSGAFFEALQLCVARFGLPNRIVVGLGPGSYAGTRIAIAAAIGLRSAAAAELLGMTSVRAMDTPMTDFAVVGDARRQSFYFARVQGRRCTAGPMLCDEEHLRTRINELDVPVFSFEALPKFPSIEVTYPSATILAQLGGQEAAALDETPLEPIYLRDAHITKPKSRTAEPTR